MTKNSTTGTLANLNDEIRLDVIGALGANFILSPGDLNALLYYQISFDGGATWNSWYIQSLSDGVASFGALLTPPIPGFQYNLFLFPGITTIRVVILTYTSGSCTGTLTSTQTPIVNPWIYGRDSATLLHILNTDSLGNLITSSIPANLSITATGTAGSAVTLTIPSVASQFHYISMLEITAYTTVARVGGATPILVTTTNLSGSPAFDFATAAAIGTTDAKVYTYPGYFKSSVSGTATTIVCPATTSVIWRVNVTYYAAP